MLILDNCAIHKSDVLKQMVEARGVWTAQHFTLTHLSFEVANSFFSRRILRTSILSKKALAAVSYPCSQGSINTDIAIVKSWLRRHYRRLQESDDPIGEIVDACETITPDKAKGWFRHSGYIFQA